MYSGEIYLAWLVASTMKSQCACFPNLKLCKIILKKEDLESTAVVRSHHTPISSQCTEIRSFLNSWRAIFRMGGHQAKIIALGMHHKIQIRSSCTLRDYFDLINNFYLNHETIAWFFQKQKTVPLYSSNHYQSKQLTEYEKDDLL